MPCDDYSGDHDRLPLPAVTSELKLARVRLEDDTASPGAADPPVPGAVCARAGANAELEPNDEFHKATPLTAGDYREDFLAPKGDVDHFVLCTTEPVLANVEPPQFEVRDAKNREANFQDSYQLAVEEDA